MKIFKTKKERGSEAAAKEWVQQLHQFEMLPDEQLAAEFVEFYHRQSGLAGRDHALLTHVACRLKDPGFYTLFRAIQSLQAEG